MAADDGATLLRRDRISSDVYSYRVWADPDGTPRDGPQEDYTPHPTGEPDGYEPAFVAPTDVFVDGLVHPDGGVDSWLPAGADHTSGNNVFAYADHYNPDGYTDGGVDVRAFVIPNTRNFHFDYEHSLGPMERESQTHAAIARLFYTTNWLHDYFYVSGFNESAGNAQNDNRGRGGQGGDALLAEAQNLGTNPLMRNNASIYVPRDGRVPRMEAYLWQMPEERHFRGSGVEYTTGRAAFGPQRFNLDSLRLVLASSGTSSATDACQPPSNDVTGAIVLADRGNCIYELKAVNAERAGAAGLIVMNHIPGGAPPEMADVDPTLSTQLPTLSITYEAGQTLKALLAGGSVNGSMARIPSAERDGALDNTVVAHEWGHLLHLRLVDCTEPQCKAQSEGWGDFIALHMMVRENDGFDGTYAIGGYASYILGQSPYYGIRRAPYSRNPLKNALRFRHVSDSEPLPDAHPLRDNGEVNSQVHNAGEVWASMLFDGYLALVDEALRSGPRHEAFVAARRRMADYVVAGMALAPVDPTFTEQRDALLMAVQARDSRDMLLLAEAFSRRGAGTCAESPPRRSLDFTEVKESTGVRADLRFEFVRVDDGVRACDARADGILDADEAGTLHLKVSNPGPVASTSGTTVTVQANRSMVSLPQGGIPLPTVPPFGSISLEVPIQLTAPLEGPRDVEFTITLIAPNSCQERTEQKHIVKLDHDLAPSAGDAFEGNTTSWLTQVLRGGEDQRWRRMLAPSSTPGEVNHLWFAKDGYDAADTLLVTPPVKVAADAPFQMTFDHRYHFAFTHDSETGQTSYWNGGVIEVTQDDGATWEDVSVYVQPGYGGTLDTTVSNTLAGRQAYVAQNAAWPGMNVNTTLDFGTKLSGKTVRLRFRFGSAWVVQAHGWEIDNVSLTGVTEGPFEGIFADAGICRPPTANAGADQTALFGAEVTLDGSGSSGPNPGVLQYSWEQLQGPPVELQARDSVRPRFTVPTIEDAEQRTLRFQLSVSDGAFTATDTVTVQAEPPKVVDPPPDPPDPPEPPKFITGGGGGCTIGATGQEPPSSWPFWLLGTMALLARSRRRPWGAMGARPAAGNGDRALR
nr:M36 family metallopeptidase [Myxococcus sp. RHSTA-1-4]